MLNAGDILETITMIQDEHLDVRTITMGISLLDCCDSDIDRACRRVYDKITRCARDLVKTGEDIEKMYGIPIINKRISVTPIAMIAAACENKDMVRFARTLEKAAVECGVNFIGGYSALVQKGFAAGDRELIESIPEALAVTVGGKSIYEVCCLSCRESLEFFEGLELTERQQFIGGRIVKEILERLRFLVDVGLDYLTLDRASATLSGGEAQRIRLATQIGAGLMGVLYILDEPSIGLHQRDNERLIKTLERLRDIGNTVIVVEHDEDTIRAADYVIDMGPGAGVNGGHVVAAGTPADIMACPESMTGAYLTGKRMIRVPDERRKPGRGCLKITGARANNLKNVTAKIEFGTLTVVTGVSGSGKSSLVTDTIAPALTNAIHRSTRPVGPYKKIEGIECIDKVIDIDQSPIGRTPRSNPATYIGLWDDLRALFASTPESKARGYSPGRFSFNVSGGRCEACKGDGQIKIEMHFLPDIYVPCEVCGGKRYNRETLEVTYRGKTISDVLDMSVTEALAFFGNIPQIKRKLQTLYDVGLGYVSLGQPATTLSGGEAQRLKLASEMGRVQDDAVFVFDEPTIGLHPLDVQVLLNVFDGLVAKGATVIVIEHDLDLIRNADYVIDMGPGGGDAGGQVVCAGTPGDIVACSASITGRYL